MLIQNPPREGGPNYLSINEGLFCAPPGGVLNKKEFLFRSTLVPVTDKYLG